jgi:hypothetical protein
MTYPITDLLAVMIALVVLVMGEEIWLSKLAAAAVEH